MHSCSNCMLPETAEATTFDTAGVCSVCRQIEVRDTEIDWDDRNRQLHGTDRAVQGQGPVRLHRALFGRQGQRVPALVRGAQARPEAAGRPLRPLVLPAADRREQHPRLQAARRRRAELHAELARRARTDAGIAQAPRRFLLALPHRHLRPHHADRDPLRDAAADLGREPGRVSVVLLLRRDGGGRREALQPRHESRHHRRRHVRVSGRPRRQARSLSVRRIRRARS